MPLSEEGKNMSAEFAEIKAAKERLENIINSVDEGIYVVDVDGYLRGYNPALERIEGYKAEDILGRHVTDVYPLNIKTSLLMQAVVSGKPILDQFQEYFINGREVSIICNTVPLFAGGEVIGAASIVRDFSRYREMMEKNLELQEKLVTRTTKTFGKGEEETPYTTFDQIIGENAALKESIQWGQAAARTGSPVFIYGETGTGKELFAQSVHMASSRRKGPFMALNCAAIPETLLEGILFGTAKGAFTGAVNRLGMIEQASGGTLFLDEINSMSLGLQAKLLRVIEDKKIRRLGDNQSVTVDVRIISSCNLEPDEAIEKGQLRSDLFYRLAVVYLVITPLRERMDDLDLLAGYFIHKYNELLHLKISGLSDEVMAVFREYYWPGNIRQLKHCIECAMNVLDPESPIIELKHLPKYLHFDQPVQKKTIFSEIEDSEKNRLKAALKKQNGNIARTAVDLGLSRQNLQYRIKKYNLK